MIGTYRSEAGWERVAFAVAATLVGLTAGLSWPAVARRLGVSHASRTRAWAAGHHAPDGVLARIDAAHERRPGQNTPRSVSQCDGERRTGLPRYSGTPGPRSGLSSEVSCE